jgi:hypothetical protein
MKKLLALALALALAPVARAATEVVAYITITNTPAGLTSNLTVNLGSASTRYWSNNAASAPSANIQTTNSNPASVTNLIAHFSTYPVFSAGAGSPQALFQFSATNTSAFTVTAPLNTNLTVTFGGNWASLFYVTNTYADGGPVQWPTNLLSAFARTQALNAIVNYLAATNRPASNSIPPGAHFLKHYPDNTSVQTLSNKTLVGPIFTNGRWVNATNITGTNVAFTNVVLRLLAASGVTTLDGFLGSLTNGALWSNFLAYATATNPVTLNLVNYGNAIRSEGAGGNSLQLGSNAIASGTRAVAVGVNSAATNTDAIAIGTSASAAAAAAAFGNAAAASANNSTAVGVSSVASASGSTSLGNTSQATGAGSTAIGQGTQATAPNAIAIGDEDTIVNGTNAVAIGPGAVAGATRSVALGDSASANYTDSTALGFGSATTKTNQIVLGTATSAVTVPGRLEDVFVTNSVTAGTNRFSARLDLTPRNNTSLANGYNSGVLLGSNVYVRLSGPSGAYTNAGFAAEVDGSYHVLEFDNPVANLTFLNDSGLEATAANRITTGTGGLVNYTNNPVILHVIYNATAQRWRLIRAIP